MSASANDHSLPRSYLRTALLLLVAPGPTHGYELLEQLPELGIHSADTGGLYRTLRAMENDGVVTSWWEESTSGPPRRTYVLTGTGRTALATEMAQVRAQVELLEELADRAERVLGRR